MGSEHLIRKGERESRHARAYHKAVREQREKREAERKRKEAERGKRTFHLPFFARRKYTTKYYNGDHSVEVNLKKGRKHPWMHLEDGRCHPHYHGARLRIMGFLTNNPEMRSRGKSMSDLAHRERERRKRRRRRELREFSRAMGAKHRY